MLTGRRIVLGVSGGIAAYKTAALVSRLVQASAGKLAMADFMPLPTAHPLCYGVTYLIADGEGVVALAGIMGGEGTGVTENTSHVLLESAFFSPGAIR